MMKWALATASLVLAGVLAAPAGAATIYQNDFQTGTTAAGFTGVNNIETAPLGGQKYLGMLGGGSMLPPSSNSTANLSLTGLDGYSSITISFDLYVMKSMDGTGIGNCCGPDYFRVDLGAANLFNETFAQNNGWGQTYGPNASDPGGTGSSASGTLGYNVGYGPDWTYSLSFTLTPTTSAAVLAFIGNSTQDTGDEAFGIDNLMITGIANVSTVPVPAALPLFASALGGLGWAAWRRKKQATADA